METKIREIQPPVTEAWLKHDSNLQESQLIQPVEKMEKSSRSKLEKDGSASQIEGRINMDGIKTKELVDQVRPILEDLNITLSYQIEEKSGEVIVKVLNRDTGEMIRQIPPENLVKLRQKLEELRGMLFNDVA